MQTYTSASTSINSVRLPSVFKRAEFRSELVFDYGSGKYTDHIKEYVNSLHKTYLPYDPYNLDDERNNVSVTLVINAMYRHFPVDVVCSNVLNVIDSDHEVAKIARYIEEIVTATGGRGYVTVYEGDRSGTGRQTGKDQYQRNAPLHDYLRFFNGKTTTATIKSGMIVVER